MLNMLIYTGRKNSYCREKTKTDNQSSQIWSETRSFITENLKRHFILRFGKGCDSLKEALVMDHKPNHKSFWCNATYRFTL